jgi:hypothetical protein
MSAKDVALFKIVMFIIKMPLDVSKKLDYLKVLLEHRKVD